MPLSSELSIDVSRFDPATVPAPQVELNKQLGEILQSGPKWYQVGAPTYRKLRVEGKARDPHPAPRTFAREMPSIRCTSFPKSIVLDEGKNITIPSREAGRDIPCRLMLPSNRQPVKGVFMHIHGGGWVLQDHLESDTYLLHLANSGSLAVISIGYRLAPENPFPAAPEDCYDAIDHLAKTSQSTYNAPLRFIGGESAGAHLALLSALHLLSQPASPPLSGLILNFGVYDLSFLPQARNFPEPLILTPDIMAAFVEAFVPEAKNKPELLKDPKISPFYADLSKYESLPPALFMLGTADALLEDSMFMATRWMVAGGEAVVKLFAGATHAFISFPVEKCPAAGEAMAVTREFLVEKVG